MKHSIDHHQPVGRLRLGGVLVETMRTGITAREAAYVLQEPVQAVRRRLSSGALTDVGLHDHIRLDPVEISAWRMTVPPGYCLGAAY